MLQEDTAGELGVFLEDPAFVRDRFMLRSKHGGAGFRSHSERICFSNALHHVAPCFDVYFPLLVKFFGDSLYTEEGLDDTSLWSTFFASGLPMARHFEEELLKTKALYGDLCSKVNKSASDEEGFISSSVDSWGLKIKKLQKEAFRFIKDMKWEWMKLRKNSLSRDDPRRRSFEAQDRFSCALQQLFPLESLRLSPWEFISAIQNVYGVRQTLLSGVVGQDIPTNHNAKRATLNRVDVYGENLKTVIGMIAGDNIYQLHNGILREMVQEMVRAGIKVAASKNHVFAHLINGLDDRNDKETEELKRGIIPDAVMDCLHLGMGWQRASADLFAGFKTLLDVKTLGPGRKYALFPIKSSSAVEQRAQEVPKDYRKAVRKIDRKMQVPEGTIGPVERELNTYGHNGEVVGLVMGAYGEFSSSVVLLADFIARKKAEDYCVSHNMGIKKATAMFRNLLTRRWGLYAHRGWAHLMLSRCRALSCGMAGEYASSAGRDSAEDSAEMEYNHLHPDRGYFSNFNDKYG